MSQQLGGGGRSPIWDGPTKYANFVSGPAIKSGHGGKPITQAAVEEVWVQQINEGPLITQGLSLISQDTAHTELHPAELSLST